MIALRERPCAVGARAHAAVHLGGDDDLVARGHREQRPAGDLFAGAGRVDVGGVEEVDAGVERLPEERLGALLDRASSGWLPRSGSP